MFGGLSADSGVWVCLGGCFMLFECCLLYCAMLLSVDCIDVYVFIV